jgi:hypothetical protein
MLFPTVFTGISDGIFLSHRVAQSVQWLATGWTTGRSRFDSWQRRTNFSCNLCVQTGSGAHPAYGCRGSFNQGKARPGRDADHSPHLVARSTMSRSYTSSTPQALLWPVVGQLYFIPLTDKNQLRQLSKTIIPCGEHFNESLKRWKIECNYIQSGINVLCMWSVNLLLVICMYVCMYVCMQAYMCVCMYV